MAGKQLNLVIKIGTLALTGKNGAPDGVLIGQIAAEISALKKLRHNVILVTSGAVGAGRALNKKHKELRHCDEVAERQIMAALGQAQLITLYQEQLAPHGLVAAQILLTKQDFRTRDHYRHMTHLFAALEKQPHILPVVNENDSVTVNELMFTDNDELSGLLAAMINADRLIILSHIAGVYDRPPSEAGASVISLIDWQSKKGLPTDVKGKSAGGRGGMASKLGIARKMAMLGIRTHIAPAREPNVITRILKDDEIGTAVAPMPGKRNAVKRWLASEVNLTPATVTANAPLATLMRDINQTVSLLPVGLTAVDGTFAKGDLVQVVDEKGKVLALGVARYDAPALRRALGKRQQPVFIHYDQLPPRNGVVMENPLNELGQRVKFAAQILAQATSAQKNAALEAIASGLLSQKNKILIANAKDIEKAKTDGMSVAMQDRLRLDERRLMQIADGVRVVESLPDPVDRLLETVQPHNELMIEKRAVPLGVVGIIFESRPNVAVDAAVLCLKSGNASILRGGSDCWQSMLALLDVIHAALKIAGLPEDTVQTLPSPDRALVEHLLQLDEYVDVIVPRGGKSLIAVVRKLSRIPVLSQLEGVCHTYIDAKADAAKAMAIAVNAKMRRTSICGATECLVLHKDIIGTMGKQTIDALVKSGCEVRVPQELVPLNPALKLAQASDYGCEFLGPVLSVAVVANIQEAVAFINTHNSRHTDAIITEDAIAADFFMRNVSSAIAMHNTSTQFADGYEFGKGAEIGIATGKLHARGPVGLQELTTYQYRVGGKGQIRG